MYRTALTSRPRSAGYDIRHGLIAPACTRATTTSAAIDGVRNTYELVAPTFSAMMQRPG
ncbi:MAG: hypothetical protein ACLU37_00730 [Collinsella sp.]